MNLQRKILLIILISLAMVSTAGAWETQYVEVENETLSILPTIEICTNTTSVFKIERENYTQNSSPLTITYKQYIHSSNASTNISKTINKYTNANTGIYTVPRNGNTTLFFEITNNTLRWTFFVNCTTTINSTNITINSTENITINQTINTSINNSNNITINDSEEPEINNSNNNQTENTTANKTICPKEFYIKTNKLVFKEKEKLFMDFISDAWPSTYEITYKITYLDGKVAKKEYTTTNNNTKTYTMKQSKEADQAHIIHATIISECGEMEAQKIVALQGVKEETETQETDMSLQAIQKESEVDILLHAQRGDSAKSVIYIFLENEQRRRVSNKIKIVLEQQESEVSMHTTIPLPEENILYVIAEGLGMYKEVKIKQTIAKEEVNQSTKDKEKNEETIIKKETNTNNIIEREEISAPTHVQKKNTTIVPVQEQKNTNFTKITFLIALASTIGIGTSIYFRKHSA